MSEETLLRLLRRVATGEDPEVVYMEEYANADISRVGGDDAGE